MFRKGFWQDSRMYLTWSIENLRTFEKPYECVSIQNHIWTSNEPTPNLPFQTMAPKFFEWTIGKRKHEFAIYVPTYIFSSRAFRLKLGKYVLSYFAILRHLLHRRNSYKFISAAKQPSNSRMKRGRYFDLRLRKYLRNLRLSSTFKRT